MGEVNSLRLQLPPPDHEAIHRDHQEDGDYCAEEQAQPPRIGGRQPYGKEEKADEGIACILQPRAIALEPKGQGIYDEKNCRKGDHIGASPNLQSIHIVSVLNESISYLFL